MAQQFTHTAKITTRGIAVPSFWKFRETAKFWVSEHGFRFRKADGTEAGAEWPTFTMHLKTIKANA